MKKHCLLLVLIFIFFFSNAQVVKQLTIEAGSLSAILTTEEKNTITDLTISGTINARDFATIREQVVQIEHLNLTGVSILEYIGFNGTIASDSLTYPANVIPIEAFYYRKSNKGMPNLKSVTLPDNAIGVGYKGFMYSPVLETVVVSASFEFFDQYAFCGSNLLAQINLPKTIKKIGGSCFAHCSGLTGKLEVPDSMHIIDGSAFSGCKGFSSIYIPATIDSIMTYAFSGCSKLKINATDAPDLSGVNNTS